MNFLLRFWKHPQQLLLRRATFQVHLWVGIVLALYVSVVGVTGAILVFGQELDRLFRPDPWRNIESHSAAASLGTVLNQLKAAYPRAHVVSVSAPSPNEPVFTAVVQERRRLTVACHPATGQVLGQVSKEPKWLSLIYDLHENLLARRTGRVVNGIGAAFLLLLCLTGLVNWWPGVQYWRRALTVDFRRRWKRVNFDLHSATGVWALAFLLVWGVSGIYFAWPDKIFAWVNSWSPIVNSRPPQVTVVPPDQLIPLDFEQIVARSYALDPGTQWKGILFPASRRSPLAVLMSRRNETGRDHEDTLYFNPYDGAYISTWNYGVNKSWGDWFVWLQAPLHFGTHWGFGVKLIWAAMGLAMPLLAVTGLLMYWNRFLGKRL